MGRSGNKISKLGEIGGATDRFESFLGFKLGGESEQVDGAAVVIELNHGLENLAMALIVKIRWFEMFKDVGKTGV